MNCKNRIKYRQAIMVDGKFDRWYYWGYVDDETIFPPLIGLKSEQATGIVGVYPDGEIQMVYERDCVDVLVNGKIYNEIVEWKLYGWHPFVTAKYINMSPENIVITGNMAEGYRKHMDRLWGGDAGAH